MPKLPKQRLAAYLFLLLNTALWGFAAPIIKYSLQFTTPVLFLFYRFCIATLIFLPVYLLYKNRTSKKTNYPLVIFLSLLGVPLTLLPLFYGLELTSSIEGSILEATSPLFIIIGGLFLLKENVKPKEWLGFLVAISGTILLTLDPLINGGSRLRDISIKGNLLILLSNLIWTIFLLLAKKYKANTTEITFFSFLVSIPFFLALSLYTGSLSLNPQALPGILYMAIPGSIIAFWAYQEGQKRIEASEAAVFSYLRPLFAIPLALLWLKEPITPITIVGFILILGGVFFSEKA